MLEPVRRVTILEAAHDDCGHKGTFPTESLIRERFWWPGLAEDVRWYCATCDTCQRRNTLKLKIPPTVARVPTLFQRLHADTMFMPVSRGFKMIVHGRCAMIGYPEARMLKKESGRAIAAWLFKDVLCRWGFVADIVTDNGPPFIAALEVLREKYGITHIRVAGYNSQANGIIER